MPVAGKRLLRSVVNWRGLESGRSKELTKTFVSKTQRNYAPFRRESSISGVSPRSFALRPTSSSTCCSDDAPTDRKSSADTHAEPTEQDATRTKTLQQWSAPPGWSGNRPTCRVYAPNG